MKGLRGNRRAVIRCAGDDEAGIWFVRESDVPGLVTEAETLDALRRTLPGMIQDLLEVETTTDIEIDLIAHAHDRVRVEAALAPGAPVKTSLQEQARYLCQSCT